MPLKGTQSTKRCVLDTVIAQTISDTLSCMSLATSAQVKHISQGAYGVVLLARDRESGEEVALKLIERGEVGHCFKYFIIRFLYRFLKTVYFTLFPSHYAENYT